MRNDLWHGKSAAILFCGLMCLGGGEVIANTLRHEVLTVQQQDKKLVKGTIVDETGQPMPGVNILVKGTLPELFPM